MKDLSKIKLELLNDEEANQLKGGIAQMAALETSAMMNTLVLEAKPTTCNKTGDTIACNLATKILACAYEVGCQPNFASSCDKKSFVITGCNVVTFS